MQKKNILLQKQKLIQGKKKEHFKVPLNYGNKIRLVVAVFKAS